MMTNTVSQSKRIKVKMLFTNLWKICSFEEVEYCKAVVRKNFNEPLVMTEDDEMRFKPMDKCDICNEKYTDKDVRVRDHCHITGKFRGSAHKE